MHGEQSGVVDLRSDTVTRPTPAMRDAIARAEVGDDTLGDDPTVQRLERRIAELLGREAALFFPSGIMANVTALAVLTAPGTEVICEARSHIVDWEVGGAAAVAGLMLRGIPSADGRLDPDAVAAAVRPRSPIQIRTSLLALENTHNAAGGAITPITTMRALRDVARTHGLPVHLDGARLWNAAAASGTSEAEFAACADTVMVALSKGLGCPAGSLLAGDADVLLRARAMRRRLGGAMRQAGILAAAGLHALDHHRDRLHEDHANAVLLATLCDGLPGIRPVPPETNIVMFDITADGVTSADVLPRLKQAGVLMTEFTPTRFRAVTHLDVGVEHVRRAAEAVRAVASELRS